MRSMELKGHPEDSTGPNPWMSRTLEVKLGSDGEVGSVG